MIEEQVVVTSHTSQGVWIEGMQQSACGSCAAKSGCGQHALSQLGRKVSLWLPNASTLNGTGSVESLQVGQQIIVGLPEDAILRSTLVLYGTPLMFLIVGALLGNLGAGEVGAIVLSVVSMLLGFYLARYWSEKNVSQWQPHYIRDCVQASNPNVIPQVSGELIQTDKL